MPPTRISASSYSNTAPLIWSFLYGSKRGSVELILDNAPARSAELLTQDRVHAALVPVIASQFIDDVCVVPGVCVGAKRSVRSVCLITRGRDIADVRSVSLDISSRTSVALTKIVFREFLGHEPSWADASPDVERMLGSSDAALIIGDPALALTKDPAYRVFDLAELWNQFTGLGFVFAMWMTRRKELNVDLASARDEGMTALAQIATNYTSDTGMGQAEMTEYLSTNISYHVDDSMKAGLDLYLELAKKHGLIPALRPIVHLS